jgi:hypothetical protein
MKTRPSRLTDTDRQALERAIEIRRQESAAERQWLDELLKERTWRDVAESCVYGCQCKALQLKPWEAPPITVRHDPDEVLQWKDHPRPSYLRAAQLLKRLLAAGLSRYEPDPLRALERVEASTRPAA